MKITAYNPDFSYNLGAGAPFSQAGGDLQGNFPGPQVWGIAGYPLNGSNAVPTTGYVMTGMGGSFGWSPAAGGGVTVDDEGTPLATAATTLDFVGAGVTASGTGATKTITIPGGGTDLSSATPLVESGAGSPGSGALASKDDHVHPAAASSGAAHYLVISSAHSTPLVFDDLVQSSAGDDLVYTT